MSHTMHRLSGDGDDFVLHVRPPKNAPAGTGRLMGDLLRKLYAFHPVNAGSPSAGTLLTRQPEMLAAGWPDGAPLHIVFDDETNLTSALSMLRHEDTGFSVSVSVPWETANRLTEKEMFRIAGIQADLAPLQGSETDWLERLLSLCGHLRLSRNNAKRLCRAIRQGNLLPEEAARALGRVCLCGCFNTTLAARLLAQGALES